MQTEEKEVKLQNTMAIEDFKSMISGTENRNENRD
jgi:hypothetical protein